MGKLKRIRQLVLRWISVFRRNLTKLIRFIRQKAAVLREISQALWLRGKTRVGRLLKAAPQRIRVFLLNSWYLQKRRLAWLSSLTFIVLAAVLLTKYWSSLDNYILSLEKTVVSELTIEIGVAMTGIIAIAFSLSLFAIQQVAERGTPATIHAYASDPVLKSIYWTLALFAIICFGLALLRAEKNYHTGGALTALALLFASFILLNVYFRRVVKFADPRYTILRVFQRGQKQLKLLNAIKANIRTDITEDPGRK